MCARASEQGEYNEFCHYFGTENSHRIANNRDAKETVRWRERIGDGDEYTQFNLG